MSDWIQQLMDSMGYLGITLLMVLENLFPPIPSEVIMPMSGYLVSQGEFHALGVIVAGTIGSVLGALPFYAVGYKMGPERLKQFCDRHGRWFAISRAEIEKTEKWFHDHGVATVFLLRLVPGLRTLVSIPAGFSRMPFGTFLLYTTLGSAIWVSILTAAGWFLGSQFEKTEHVIGPISTGIIVLLLIAYVWRVIMGSKKRS